MQCNVAVNVVVVEWSVVVVVVEAATQPSRFAHFWQGAQSPAPATKNDIWTSKSAPYPHFFALLTWKLGCQVSQGKKANSFLCFRHESCNIGILFSTGCHNNCASNSASASTWWVQFQSAVSRCAMRCNAVQWFGNAVQGYASIYINPGPMGNDQKSHRRTWMTDQHR